MTKKTTKKFVAVPSLKELRALPDGTRLEWVPGYEEHLQYAPEDIKNDRCLRLWHTFRSKRLGGRRVRIEIKSSIWRIPPDKGNALRQRAVFRFRLHGKKLLILRRSQLTMLCIMGFAITDRRHWVVDHIDGNTLNDRPSNLQVISQKENIGRSERVSQSLRLNPHDRTRAAQQRIQWMEERRQQLLNIHAEALAAGDMDLYDIEFDLAVEMNERF